MNDDFNAKIKLLIKSEKALLSLELRKKSKETFWVVLGIVALFVSLVMVNITAYLYLSESFSNAESAGILTIINIVLAGIFFSIASKQDRGAEAESIEDIRDFAWQQVSTDIDEVKENIQEFTQSIVKVKDNVESFTKGDTFGIKKVLPIVTTLIDLARKR